MCVREPSSLPHPSYKNTVHLLQVLRIVYWKYRFKQAHRLKQQTLWKSKHNCIMLYMQGVPLATEPGIS